MESIATHIKVIVNSLGLLFGIVGAYLIWKFGLPASIDREGHQHLITGEIDEDEVATARKFDFRSRIGLLLLIVSFALQLLSNFL